MNHQLSFFPSDDGDVLSDFLIVINPSDDIGKDVELFKTEFYEIFGSYPSRHSEPHITVADIHCLPKNEDKVISSIRNNHPKTGSFLVDINGFSDYEGNGNRVIHMHVKQSEEFEKLEKYYKQMKMVIHRYKKRYYVSDSPHITIARGLRREVFETAKRVYLPRPYQNSFEAKSLIILRREIEDKKATRYEKFGEIPL